MKVLIEGYYYDPAVLEREQVTDGLIEYHRRPSDGFVCYNYVGHVYSPMLKDYIFFLPKVVLEEKGTEGVDDDRVFGEKPEDIICVSDKDGKINAAQRGFVCELAVWVYRALMIYREAHPDQNILLERNIAQIGNRRQRLSDTLLDIILELIRFNRENQDYVLFVLKSIHSGYNKINWRRTIAHSQAIVQDGVPVYLRPVNKKKQVNFDEELFIIYFSILNYISSHYGFCVNINMGFELITGSKFRHYLDGYGRVRMRQIRYKYFSDKALRLWELCYAFFDKSHAINVRDDQKEYLLAQNFNIVFEAIIDELVGSKDIPSGLKEQKDGKRVDHMYTFADLVYPGAMQKQVQKEIYYIGDSKYYKIGSTVGDESVYKQYTYARNVIQWNLDLFLSGDEAKKQKDNPKNIWLRDETTEGYNIIPNFFISAFVDKNLSFENDNLKKRETVFNARQFENRLFDRDTLIITHYDVNFLYVLSLYARNNAFSKASWKVQVRELFRKNIQEELNSSYSFYAITAREGVNAEQFMQQNFQQLLGKVYTPYGETGSQEYYSVALDNGERFANENERTLSLLAPYFYMEKCPVGTKPESVLPKVEQQAKGVVVPESLLTLHYVQRYLKDNFLIGCYKDEAQLNWIMGANDKGTNLYNVRIFTKGLKRAGTMKRSQLEQGGIKFVILYRLGEDFKNEYRVFHVHHHAVMSEERMRQALYPNPQGNYFCFVFDEEVSISPDVNLAKILTECRLDTDTDYQEGAPVVIKGEELLRYQTR